MPYVLLDDRFAMHRKIVQAGNEACGVHARTLSWCGGNLTDGHVPHSVDEAMAGRKAKQLRDRLIAAGLRDACDEHEACSVIHDFVETYGSAEEIKEARRRAADRKRRWRSSAAPGQGQDAGQEGGQGAGRTLDETRDGRGTDAGRTRRPPRMRQPTTNDQRTVPTSSGAEAPAIDVQVVVAAWVDGAQEANGERPPNRLVSQVGRQVRELAGEARWSQQRLVEAAHAAGVKGYADIPRELLRGGTSNGSAPPRGRVTAGLELANRLAAEGR